MTKNTKTYWNALDPSNDHMWEVIENSNDLLEQYTLAIDEETGDYTRLTRFKPGADTKSFGSKSHDYPEEIIVIKGRLYDEEESNGVRPSIPRDKSHQKILF